MASITTPNQSLNDKKSQGDIHWPKQATQLEQQCDSNTRAKLREESAKKALALKKKELKWKLMQVSQAQNLAKLREIQTAVNYHRRKLSKAQDLAARLRDKYIKVVKSARLTELQFKKAEAQLSQQERFVADEKMQLTKLAFDCISNGTELFGATYKLPENSTNHNKMDIPVSEEQRHKSAGKRIASEFSEKDKTISMLDKLSPFLRKARLNANHLSGEIDQRDTGNKSSSTSSEATTPTSAALGAARRPRRARGGHLSSIYDLDNSIFKNFASYRLTSKFAETGSLLTDLVYSHNISPLEYVCLPDLLGECSDKTCRYQHKSNYHMTDLERLTDLLSYRPQVAGFKPDPDLSPEENKKMCRIKLKQYAAKLISRNANKSVEAIARNLVKKIRAEQADKELILKRRELPKATHLKTPPPRGCPCEAIVIEDKSDSSTSGADPVTIKLEPISSD